MEFEFAALQRAVTVLLNLSLAVLVGAGAAMSWLRTRSSPWAREMLARLRALLLAASGATSAAYAAIVWVEAASMAELPLAEAWPAVVSVIGATHYGAAWTIGAAALLVAAGVSAAPLRVQAGLAATVVRSAAIGLLLYARSMVSHAGAAGGLTWAVAVDWAHLALVCLWVGGVIVAGLLALRRLPAGAGTGRADCAAYVAALSRSASFALAGIVASGAYGAWRVLEHPGDLADTPYGTTLLVKLGLVLCAAALGGFNRFFVMPSLLRALRPTGQGAGAADAAAPFARILQVEAVVLAAAVVAAAVLTSTPPPLAS